MVSNASFRIMDILTHDQRVALEALTSPVSFPPKHTIFWEGQPSHSVLIIQKGNVKVTQQAADGTEIILAIRGAEEVMGEEGVLMGEVRSATVTAITEVVGLDIRAEDLLRFVEENQLWPVMYQAAVRRRYQSDQRALLTCLDVKSRLARWLLELAAEVGDEVEDSWVIESTLSQQDLASRIGASREAVAIELRKFRDQGLVSTGRRKVVLYDLDTLRRISSGERRNLSSTIY